MGRRYSIAAALLACFAAPVLAQQAPSPFPAAAAQTLPKSIELRGKLGQQDVQMHLEVKPEEEDGWKGHYVVQGKDKKILLAGEANTETLSLEESEDGIDVTGQWDGKWETTSKGKLLRGTWTSDDGTRTLEFVLAMLPTTKKPVKKLSSAPVSPIK